MKKLIEASKPIILSILTALFVLIVIMAFSQLAIAEGSKNNNPVKSVEVGEDCVLVFADGLDKDKCEETTAPDQSQQAYLCEVVMICPDD